MLRSVLWCTVQHCLFEYVKGIVSLWSLHRSPTPWGRKSADGQNPRRSKAFNVVKFNVKLTENQLSLKASNFLSHTWPKFLLSPGPPGQARSERPPGLLVGLADRNHLGMMPTTKGADSSSSLSAAIRKLEEEFLSTDSRNTVRRELMQTTLVGCRHGRLAEGCAIRNPGLTQKLFSYYHTVWYSISWFVSCYWHSCSWGLNQALQLYHMQNKAFIIKSI